MASLSFLATTSTVPLLHPHKLHPSPASSTTRRTFYTSCSKSSNSSANTTNANDNEDRRGGNGSLSKLDRRNVLLGLGGLYGASTIVGSNNIAIGAPISLPDLSKCHLADAGSTVGKVECCPPYNASTPIADYKFPSLSKPLRVRRPAHLLDKEELEKYKLALKKMRELTIKDPNDPRGWMQQAMVHCQYCNGAYDQVGVDESIPIQVHYSWLFAPWHRWYLHFYERILGSLIGDDSFALPFWNWDTPNGMTMPNIFTDSSSSLYNDNRNKNHYSPVVMDYQYVFGDPNPSEEETPDVIKKNLLELHVTYNETLSLPELFMGGVLRAGQAADTDTSAGKLEGLHNTAHMWAAPEASPHLDMGNFYSAGRDPIFFSHHSNVDRMWHIYRSMRGNEVEFEDTDWLDSTFLFADENSQLVRVKLRDCFNPIKLRYTYEEVELPWAGPGKRKKFAQVKAKTKTAITLSPVTSFGSSPRVLDTTIRVLVERPKKSRSKSEKQAAVEALVITGIQAPIFEPSRFDVYITTTPGGDNLVGPDLGEFAGSFTKIPHHGNAKDSNATTTKNMKLKLGLNNLLEDIDADASDKLVVSLVPRLGKITVGGVSFELLKTKVSSS